MVDGSLLRCNLFALCADAIDPAHLCSKPNSRPSPAVQRSSISCPETDGANLVRIVVGRSGRVDFRTEYVVRFNYGGSVPWVSRLEDGAINAIAGPERLVLRTPATLYGEDLKTIGEFTVETATGGARNKGPTWDPGRGSATRFQRANGGHIIGRCEQ
jgi:hypothetical protein